MKLQNNEERENITKHTGVLHEDKMCNEWRAMYNA